MAYNIIDSTNSRTTSLYDVDENPFLFVAEGAYIIDTGSFSGYRIDGSDANITVQGSIISNNFFGIYCFGSGGSNHITITSSGFVSGTVAVTCQTNDVIRNSGQLVSTSTGGAGIALFGDDVVVNNDGSILADFGIRCNNYYLSLQNSGIISSHDYAIYSNSQADIINTGTIDGAIRTIDALSLVNSGSIDGNINASINLGVTTIANFATINGNITTGSGDDTIDTGFGVIAGVVDLGGGADTYVGGDRIDRVIGGAGADTIELGDGRDVYRATDGDGNDDLDGGDGVDTYNASAVTTTITLNLGAATTGNAVGNDTIAGFENVIGGSAADNLSGDDGANRIDGQDGADVIFGDSGNDRLIGGLGTDTITGGAGRDILTGGDHGSLDSDKFVFAVGDSGATASTRDVITDFRDHRSNVPAMFLSNPDQINLSAIDANTGVAGDQAFSFNETGGAAFSGAAGSLIWRQFTGFALISGDTNGDGTADFVIQLNGTHGLFTSDFVL